jgi:thiamine biosynthesis lipoprotein
MAFAKTSYPLWGGIATILVAEPERLDQAAAAVDHVIAEIDAACNPFRAESVVSRVNAAAGRPVRVSPIFLEVLRAAVRASRATRGLVDPSAGSAPVDWNTVRPEGDLLTLPAGSALDFGAIGKAFAADRAAARAAAETGCGVLVGLAGDIAIAGEAPRPGWPVRVSDDHRPGPDGRLPFGQDILLTAPGGLATSSLTVRTRTLSDGQTVTHIVDPRTGMPVRGPWRTVSVSAGSCVDANIATTETLVLGHDGRLAFRGLPARLVNANGWVHTLGGWPADHSERPGIQVAS